MDKRDIKPALLVMAAGMGSRYGKLKQIDPVDEEGHVILDFSVYDAMLSGFGEAVFVIKEENLTDFREAVGNRIGRKFPVRYAFQSLNSLPEGFSVPEGRVKPWGTAQAVLSASEVINTPFAVINADDFYGRHAFTVMADFLKSASSVPGEPAGYAMTAFILNKTLTKNGSVSRGIVESSGEGLLLSVTERTRIEQDGEGAKFTTDEGKTWVHLSGSELVSMNFWGFTPSLFPALKNAFRKFLEALPASKDPLKAECQLPGVVDGMIKDGKARVKILSSDEQWYGVTYQEDKPGLSEGLKSLKEKGLYPSRLWES
ncbi:MAG: nucleotidyltransferase [Lachnospiraceae bacterium]|nr:nucleotidyltransferase [Lachnospiraceae bacterium]